MYTFAAESADAVERARWLRSAAEEGYPPAMHGLAVNCRSPWERQRWLVEAARNGYEPSIVELATTD
jgi:hypothetical protein